MRKTLKENSILHCGTAEHNIDFVIDKYIGSGANCNVYDAYYIDDATKSKHRFRIKELYPVKADISRNDGELKWNIDAERENAFSDFTNAYNLLGQLHNEEALGNQTANPEILFGCNNTLYTAISADFGVSYDKVKEQPIAQIIDTILALTKTISAYHKCGYLHLDIKPSNFLVNYSPILHLVLFDVDTVTAISDVNGLIKCSYSESYAAPEQMQFNKSRISPATDIYAIGCILFERIMGRLPVTEDKGITAEWGFAEVELLNDKERNTYEISRILKEIFKKTLAANSKRRYQSADELVSALENLRQVYNQRIFIRHEGYVASSVNFLGRNEELSDIQNNLKNSNFVFLSGIGGIGKTELLKAYAQKYSNCYSSVSYVSKANSLDEVLKNIPVCGSPANKVEFCRDNLNENSLLIVDDPQTDKLVSELKSLHCKILVATRKDYSVYYKNAGGFSFIKIGEMNIEDQIDLFNSEYANPLSPCECDNVQRILKLIAGYTLLITLTARQLKKLKANTNVSFNEYIEELNSNGLKERVNDRKVYIDKDEPIYGKIWNILLKVFDLSSFTPDGKTIMGYFSVISPIKISAKTLFEKIAVDKIDEVDDLVKTGWISTAQINGEISYYLHDVIAELVMEEFRPGWKDVFYFRNMFNDLMSYIVDDNNCIFEKCQYAKRIFITVYETLSKTVDEADELAILKQIIDYCKSDIDSFPRRVYMLSDIIDKIKLVDKIKSGNLSLDELIFYFYYYFYKKSDKCFDLFGIIKKSRFGLSSEDHLQRQKRIVAPLITEFDDEHGYLPISTSEKDIQFVNKFLSDVLYSLYQDGLPEASSWRKNIMAKFECVDWLDGEDEEEVEDYPDNDENYHDAIEDYEGEYADADEDYYLGYKKLFYNNNPKLMYEEDDYETTMRALYEEDEPTVGEYLVSDDEAQVAADAWEEAEFEENWQIPEELDSYSEPARNDDYYYDDDIKAFIDGLIGDIDKREAWSDRQLRAYINLQIDKFVYDDHGCSMETLLNVFKGKPLNSDKDKTLCEYIIYTLVKKIGIKDKATAVKIFSNTTLCDKITKLYVEECDSRKQRILNDIMCGNYQIEMIESLDELLKAAKIIDDIETIDFCNRYKEELLYKLCDIGYYLYI